MIKEVKLFTKIAVTFFTLLTVISSLMLYQTAEIEPISQSRFWDQPNRIWYIMIHIGIIMSFFILNAQFRKKYAYGLVAFASIITVGFDMINWKIPHNIATAVIFFGACHCLIMYTDFINKRANTILCSILALIFGIAIAWDSKFITVYEAETVIEWMIGAIIVCDIWDRKNYII